MSRLDELGRRLAAEQDRMLEERTDIADVRQRLASSGTARPTAPWRRPWLAVAVAAGLAAALVAGFLVARISGTPDPEPPVAPENWRPGAWVTAPDNAGVPIRFTDGSVVQLEPRAEACVLSATAAVTRMVLRRGAAKVDVVHRDGLRWKLEVGPFVVQITGTSFRVDWDPNAQTFRIELERGGIDVTGPMLAGGRRMAPGEVMRVWVAERRVEVRSDRGTTVAAAPPAPAPVLPSGAGGSVGASSSTLPVPTAVVAPPVSSGSVPAVPGPSAPPGSSGIRGPAVRTPTGVPPTAPSGPSWQELAREGRYRDALAVAEAAGFERLLGEASATALVALGDAARLAGRADLGEQAYLALRRRFPGTSEAGVAAFDLARIAFDLRGDYDSAASWLRTCLAEPRASGVAREASGRLIEALQRAGHVDQAVAAARDYLQRDPTGPHADYARALLALEPEPRAGP